MSLMNKEQIMEIIPHRDPSPCLLILLKKWNRSACVCHKVYERGRVLVQGHFPGYPVVPGVLMLEMLAQAGAVAMLALPENKGKIGSVWRRRDACS